MAKSHATEEDAERAYTGTLCGIDNSLDEDRVQSGIAAKTKIDNALPDCKRCLRVIEARNRDLP